MDKFKGFLVGAACLALAGCSTYHHNSDPGPNALQAREAQSRVFEDADVRSVLKAMINVLQDEGYIVKNAVVELGLLTAEKSLEIQQPEGGSFLSSYFQGCGENCPRHAVLEVSANISEYGESTKIRVNFLKKSFDAKGCLTAVCQVADESHYQSFFSKVSKGIFFLSENL